MCGPAASPPAPVQVQLPETAAVHSGAPSDVTVTLAPGSAEPATTGAAPTVSPAAGEVIATGGAKPAAAPASTVSAAEQSATTRLYGTRRRRRGKFCTMPSRAIRLSVNGVDVVVR